MNAPVPSEHPNTENRDLLAGAAAEGARCPHCGGWTPDDEYRCRYCQRRLKPGGPPTHQGLLFAAAEKPKVIPFESIAPSRAAPARRPAAQRLPAKKAQAPPPRPKASAAQQDLELPPPARLQTAPQPAVYCDAPIAPLTQRCGAAAIDAALVLSALALALVVFWFLGGQFDLGVKTLPWYCGFGLALGLFYKATWAAAGGDSAGVRWAGLRLLNFDGQQPAVRQRLLRLFGACISASAAGLGLMWPLLDREKLTWHDHISNTFLTPHEAVANRRAVLQ